jgi:hypothetical protein
MPPIDDVVSKVRKQFFARNFLVGEFDNDTVKEAIDGALEEYSRYRPRKKRRDDVDLVQGSYYIDLPSDFMQADIDQILFIVTGNSTSNYAWGSTYYSGRNALSVFDSQLGATEYPPPSIFYGSLVNTPDGLVAPSSLSSPLYSVELTTSDTGSYQLALSSPIAANETRTITYDAFHVINDTKNTVPSTEQNLLINLALSGLLFTLATDLLSKPNSIKTYNVANQYKEISKEYRKGAINKLRKYGFVG